MNISIKDIIEVTRAVSNIIDISMASIAVLLAVAIKVWEESRNDQHNQ